MMTNLELGKTAAELDGYLRDPHITVDVKLYLTGIFMTKLSNHLESLES